MVDYLGNELVVTDEQKRELTPPLLKHLEIIGRAMFSPDSQGNLVINSAKAKAFTDTSFIENSPDAKVENSPDAKVENSDRAKVIDGVVQEPVSV